MVFSSLPLYHIDPPNWPQVDERSGNGTVVEQHSSGGGGGDGGGGGGTARPNSMAERARQAKIPQPESALKCPRCESTNTKFCYFNNYSLSQPRHFCKTCRRYWTRGGALRSVPVGGGCRRNNKRTKSSSNPTSTITTSRSKSPLVTENNNNQLLPHATGPDSIFHAPHLAPQLPILSPLGSFGGIGQSSGGGGGGGVLLSNGIVEQWRLQQFPLGFDCGGLLYSGETGGVKMEENGAGVNLSRNFMGISGNEIGAQYWNSSGSNNNNNAWSDHGLSGFTPSSTTHLL